MMKLMSLKQYMKMSKPALIRKITKALRVMPKVKLARLCYNITKSKLPRLRPLPYKAGFIGRQKALKWQDGELRRKPSTKFRRKTKRKFSRKQLAAQRLFAKRARAGTLRR